MKIEKFNAITNELAIDSPAAKEEEEKVITQHSFNFANVIVLIGGIPRCINNIIAGSSSIYPHSMNLTQREETQMNVCCPGNFHFRENYSKYTTLCLDKKDYYPPSCFWRARLPASSSSSSSEASITYHSTLQL